MPFLLSSQADIGEWFPYGKDHDGKLIRFRVRRLSGGKENEIELRYQKATAWSVRKGEAHLKQDASAKLNADIDKAVFSLVDSENCAIVLPDDEWAGKYGAALGRTVKAGEVVVLDGGWGLRDERQRYALKELFLGEVFEVARFVVEKAKLLGVQAAEEDEAGKGGSSSS